MPARWHAYLNIASGWPPTEQDRVRSLELAPRELGSGSRAVRKKPSISFTCAKWVVAGVSPRSSGPNPWLRADCTTWAEPSSSAASALTPGGATDHSGSSPSSRRKPPCHRRDERRVERREEGELDVDASHRDPLSKNAATHAARPEQGGECGPPPRWYASVDHTARLATGRSEPGTARGASAAVLKW